MMEKAMRRKIAVGILSAVLIAGAGSAFAQFGGIAGSLMGGGGSSGSVKADAEKFSKYLAAGTVQMLNSVAKIQEATGHAKAAESALLQADNIKKNGLPKDADEQKKVYATIDSAQIESAELAKVPESKGKVALTKSAIHLGTGAILDKNALTMAQKLVANKPSASDLLDGSIVSAIDTARTAIDVLPGHIEKAGTWTGFLTDYFSSHKVTPPSAADKKKALAEDVGADEANTLFN
jgi:hypothetical protein